MIRRARLFVLFCLVLGLAGCFSDDFKISVFNGTQYELTAYPVVQTPGAPPSRQREPAGDISPGDSGDIDVDAFNPLWYAPDQDEQANVLFLGLALGDDPPVIQYKVMSYSIAPDQAQTIPATLILQKVVEVSKGTISIRLNADWTVDIQ